MGNEPRRVAIVVDPDFGEGLFELSRQSHVWIADTAGNRATAERAWTSSVDDTRTTGVTTFEVDISDSRESWVIDILDMVDDHHGLRAEWSSDVSLQIFGTAPSPRIKEALLTSGPFELHQLTPSSFEARRLPGV